MMKKKNSSIFYGWVIVLCCMLLSGASTGIISLTGGLFVKPVSETFDIARSQFSLYATISTITSMVILPFVGGIYKRFPFKTVMICGALLGVLGFLVFSVAPNIYFFYAAALLIGVSTAVSSAIPIVMLISNWFVDKLAVATAIAFAGSGVAMMFVSTPITKLIETAGWRASYRILAVIFAAIVIPIVLFVIKEKPQDMGCEALGAKKAQSGEVIEPDGLTKNQALKTKAFWVFSAGIFLIAMTANGTQQHVLPYWSDIGLGEITASNLFTLGMLVSVFSKPLLGEVYDKLGVRKASVLISGVAALSFVVLIVCKQASVAWLGAVMFGLATSIQIVPPTYMTNRLFGAKDYSSIYGVITTIFYCGVSLGTPLSAWIFDTTGSYNLAWVLYAVCSVLTAVLLLTGDTMARKSYFEILGKTRD